MKQVQLESPYEGSLFSKWLNVRYAQRALRDSLLRGEAPFASHVHYTVPLRDSIPHERALGIEAGFVIGEKADLTVFYIDRGMSRGMWLGLEDARRTGRAVAFRSFVGHAGQNLGAARTLLQEEVETFLASDPQPKRATVLQAVWLAWAALVMCWLHTLVAPLLLFSMFFNEAVDEDEIPSMFVWSFAGFWTWPATYSMAQHAVVFLIGLFS